MPILWSLVAIESLQLVTQVSSSSVTVWNTHKHLANCLDLTKTIFKDQHFVNQFKHPSVAMSKYVEEGVARLIVYADFTSLYLPTPTKCKQGKDQSTNSQQGRETLTQIKSRYLKLILLISRHA